MSAAPAVCSSFKIVCADIAGTFGDNGRIVLILFHDQIKQEAVGEVKAMRGSATLYGYML